MADFTITISNNLYAFGGSPSSRWGEVEWGSFLWGDGSTPMIWTLGKIIGNNLNTDSSINKVIGRTILNDMNLSSDEFHVEQIDAEGWNYVFPNPTIDAEASTFTVWTEI
jgi:hypothetical protein